MEINQEVGNYLEKLNDVSLTEKGISDLEEYIDTMDSKLKRDYLVLKDRMIKGEKLKDPALDYAVFHFGPDATKKTREVRHFFANIEELKGQLILEDLVGYELKVGMRRLENIPRSFNLGRLLTDDLPYLIDDNRTVTTNVFTNYLATTKYGWIEQPHPLIINPYIDSYVERPIIHGLGEEEGEKEEKFRVEIRSPINRSATIGASKSYDSEPHKILIVGDNAVKTYLEKEGIKVSNVSKSPLGIPNI